MNLKTNPEYSSLVPQVSQEQYESLKESISNNGQWFPIIANYSGEILDGHHRYKICKELGLEPQYVCKEFDNLLLEKKFVIEANLKRRHLNDYQRAELGIPLQQLNSEIAKSKMSEGGKTKVASNEKPFHAGKETAKEIGVSPTTFERAKKVIEKATDSVKNSLRDGTTSISKEYQKIQKDEKRKERQDKIKDVQVNLPESVTLYNQEFQSAPIQENSVSLIMTDPPYHDKYLHLYEDLARHASKVLKDNGNLVCYVGQGNIGKVINFMEKHGLKFHWPLTVKHSGPSASVFGKKILVACKLMLWFVKGTYDGEFVKDFVQSEFQGKELHEWAQSSVESDYYIKYMTIENEIVYDPFLGSGTFGVSAISQNRQFIGCEVDPEHFATAQRVLTNG